MIQRQDELTRLASDIEAVEQREQDIVEQADQLQDQLKRHEQAKEDILRQLGDVNRLLTDISADRSARLMKIEQITERRKRLRQEIDELEKQLQVEQGNIITARATLQAALDQMEDDNAQREELLLGRDEQRRVLDSARQKARMDKDQSHQLALRHQTMLAQLNSLKVTLERVRVQVRNYEQRRDQLLEHLKTTDDPLPGLRDELEEKLSARVEVEDRMRVAKAKVDELEHSMRGLDTRRHQLQESNQHLRDALVSRKLTIEGATVKRAALEQSLQELNYDSVVPPADRS